MMCEQEVIRSNENLADEIRKHFGLPTGISFDPSSWFSYGSNLNSCYFEKKMKKKPRFSDLKLLKIRKALLPGYRRELNNESSGHGLSYAIWENGSGVEGIVHDVPLVELANYLNMEGLVDLRNYRLWKSPRYRIIDIEKSTIMSGVPHVLTLVGIMENSRPLELIMREKGDELLEYVRASLQGAIEEHFDSAPFQAKLEELEFIARSIGLC